MKQMQFRASDSGPYRAERLSQMAAEICDHEARIDALEATVGVEPPGWPSNAETDPSDSSDPGDLTIYFDNGRA